MIELPISVAAPNVSNTDALADGTRLGEFEIRGLIGVGGFGMVYRAYDHSLQRDVAIKEYMPTALAGRVHDGLHVSVRTSSDHETFQNGLRTFVAEARMLAKFEHPSLVRVFRFWEANDTAYMVMPLYRGMTLKQARQCMHQPPTEAWLRKVLWCILGALKMLHRGTALHRDVSPDNIFLQDSGPPVLLDLGAARFAIGDTARQHTAILKVNYAPIEQYADSQGMPQGPWTDLYALAAVVYGLLRNEPPLPAMIRVVNDTMPPFGQVVKTVAVEWGQHYSDPFIHSIAKALSVQPQDRPQSVREFARSLGLTTPHGLSSFDWRAELGPACLPASPSAGATPDGSATEKTRPSSSSPGYAPTQFMDPNDDSEESAASAAHWGPDSTPATRDATPVERRHRPREPLHPALPLESPAPARGKKPARSAPAHGGGRSLAPKAATWTVLVLLVLLGVLATAWGLRGGSAKAPAPASPRAALPEEIILEQEPARPPGGASEAVAQGAPPETAMAGGAPALAASAPADSKAKISGRPRPASKPPQLEAPKAAPSAEPASATPPPAAVVQAVSAPPPAPVTAESLCADANFLSRPMCLFRACQRPELAGTARCIELQKNLQRDRDPSENG